jgi:aryl-alcohol dehydrogenase-like predicted oxidoreductase
LKSLKEDKEFLKKGSKLKISRLCLGTAQLGMRYGINNESGKPEFEESKAIVDLAIKNKINAFDTAPVYGNSEKILGKCLEKQDKDKLVLISKLPAIDWNKENDEIIAYIRNTVKKTLKDLKIKCIPVYLFRKFDDMEKENRLALNELKAMKTEGLIGKIGVSIYTPEEAERALSIDDVEVIQVPFNLIDKRLLKNGFLKRAKKKGLLVFARSVFLQGLFFKKDIPDNLKAFAPYQKEINRICGDIDLSIEELALAYALSIGSIDSVVIGAETAGQLKINIETANKIKLPVETLKMIEDLGSAPENIINPSLWGKHG